jgi:hypothetical protein
MFKMSPRYTEDKQRNPLYDMQAKIPQAHRCAVCQGPLVIAHGGHWGIEGDVIRCGKVAEHEGVEKYGRWEYDRDRMLAMGATPAEIEDWQAQNKFERRIENAD